MLEMLSLTRKITTDLHVFLDLPAVYYVWFDFPFFFVTCVFSSQNENEMYFKTILQKRFSSNLASHC